MLSAEATRGAVTPSDWQRAGGPVVLPLAADSFEALHASIERRLEPLEVADPYALAREAAQELAGRKLRAVFVGRGRAELRAQLELAARDLPAVNAEGGEWATPAGSFFTARPIGPDGKVALVYPGAFNSYPGLGQDFFRAFPGLLDRFESQADEPALHLRSRALYPRTQVTPGRRELMGLEAELGEDIPFMLATGTSFAILYTDLVREVLGVRAHGGFGYSLGESSMLLRHPGLAARGPPGRPDQRYADLPGPVVRARRTVRELLGPARVPRDAESGPAMCCSPTPARGIGPRRYDRVHLTHINTPGELVIAGDPAQCRALVEELGCPAARSPVNASCTARSSTPNSTAWPGSTTTRPARSTILSC